MAPLQSRGEHNPRDFDKYVWRLPVPLYDPGDDRHKGLVEGAALAEEAAATVNVSGIRTFQAQRRRVREALRATGITKAINAVVRELLGQ